MGFAGQGCLLSFRKPKKGIFHEEILWALSLAISFKVAVASAVAYPQDCN